VITPGETIDFSFIEEDLKSFATRFKVPEVAYDPYQATQFSQRMMAEGLEMTEVRPTVLNFSEPMKELEARIVDLDFRYNDDVFTWMVGNVVATLDKKDNIYPNKERPENSIDGVVALLMAMNRWISTEDTSMPDDYSLTLV
jgi:phage terminase large subunit-like protein